MDVTTGASAESASPADTDWRSRWLTVARRAWPVVTGLALVANLIALPAFARSQLNHTIRAELPAWHLSPAGYVAVMIGLPAVFMLVCLLVSALIVLGADVQVYRYRRVSTLTERQQTKWVMLGVAAFVVVFAATRLIGNVATTAPLHTQVADNIFATGSIFLAFAFIPVCIGIAVLRTRLWDIGLVISRTLTYTVVTALLVGVYAGLVLLATRVLAFTTPVAVAGSTLAAAAVFNPVCQRVQRAVDRPFNRARYDADQAIAAFAARLQDAADPDAVHAHLLAAVPGPGAGSRVCLDQAA